MDAGDQFRFTFIGFSVIALITWYSSRYPRQFIKIFVPREDYRHAVRCFLRDPDFARGMRVMACLQLTVGAVFGLVSCW